MSFKLCGPLLALTVLTACATGAETPRGDGPVVQGDAYNADAGVDGYVWPDLGPSPDAFIWPDGLPDAPAAEDAALLDAAPADAGVDSQPQPDSGTLCPDPYEPNEVCTGAKSLGSTKEGSSWLSKTATSNPSGDVDWYTADGEESSSFCFPGTSQCFYLKVRLQVPQGRQLKLCVMQDSCNVSATCADNSGSPGPQQLEVKYKVSGTCAFNDDTTAKIWVEQLDAAGACDPYTIEVNYDEC